MAVAILAGGCGSDNSGTERKANQNGAASLNPDAHGAPAVDAKGWTGISLDTDLTQVRIRPNSHWDIDQNFSMMSDSGAILDNDFWNRFMAMMNAAVTTPPSPQETCIDRVCPLGFYSGKDKVDVALESGGTLTLFKGNGNAELCTHIADPQLAKSLLKTLSQIVITADGKDKFGHYRCGS